jgi:hypothetical protein
VFALSVPKWQGPEASSTLANCGKVPGSPSQRESVAIYSYERFYVDEPFIDLAITDLLGITDVVAVIDPIE